LRRSSLPPDDFIGKRNDNIEFLKAWAGTTLAFAIFLTGAERLLAPVFVQNLLISGVAAGLGIVLHELAHRVVARSYGAKAHFIANDAWLVFSVLIAFTGFFCGAPGAVWHEGYLTKRQVGMVALAGPVTNLAMAVIFFLVLAAIMVGLLPAPAWLQRLCYVGFSLNAVLGFFNMIPFGPLDGAKVLEWSPVVFGVTLLVGLLLSFVLTRDDVLVMLLSLVQRLF